MATDDRQKRGLWFRIIPILASLALLALACAPAEEPTATSSSAAVVEEEAAPTATAASAAQTFEVSETGTYIERAGMQIFIPDGFTFGSQIIPPDPREPRFGGTLTHMRSSDTPSLDPSHTTSMNIHSSVGAVYERLIMWPTEAGTDWDPNNPYVPGLAESWETSDDFLTWTFNLRQGVKWHNVPPVNGRELTSDDVLFSYEWLTKPDSILGGGFKAVSSVEAVDRYTVVYHLNKVAPGLFDELSVPGKGYILPREAGSGQWNIRLSAIGTGPFMAHPQEYVYKVGMNLNRNPDYWVKDERGNRLPYLDGVKIRVIPDFASRLAAFRTGKVDDGWNMSHPQEVRDLLRTNPNTRIQERIPLTSSVGWQFRLDREPWGDVRLRRALALAVNFTEMANALFESSYVPSTVVRLAWVGEDDGLENMPEWFQYDPEQAKQLLAEAGYGPDNTLEFTFEFFNYSPTHLAQIEYLQAYWNVIGVKANLSSQEYTIYRQNVDTGSWTDVQWAFDYPLPSQQDAAVGSLVPGAAGNDNLGWVNDPELTSLVEEFQAAYGDESKRRELWEQIRFRHLDQVYHIPDARGRGYRAVPPRMRNYQPSVHKLTGNSYRPMMHAWIDEAWEGVK